MARTISSIYGKTENLVPFYPDVEYSQPKGRNDTESDQDAMFLKLRLTVSYEQAIHWLKGIANDSDRCDCEAAMKKLLLNCKETIRNRLMAISRRYSLVIADETTCSRKSSSSSSKVKPDIIVKNQVDLTNVKNGGLDANHVTHATRVEVSDEKEIIPQSKKVLPTTRYDAKLKIRSFIRQNASDSSAMIEGTKYLFQRGPGFILKKTKHLEVSIDLYKTGKVSFYLYSYDADKRIDAIIRGGLKLPHDSRFVFEWHKPRAYAENRLVCYLRCKDIDWRRLSKTNLETLTNGYEMLVSALKKINALN